jgi:hypothetical protein
MVIYQVVSWHMDDISSATLNMPTSEVGYRSPIIIELESHVSLRDGWYYEGGKAGI